MPIKPALNFFDDVKFYYDLVGADDGDNYDYDPATDEFTAFPALSTMSEINVDKLAVKRTRTLVDHSTANSKYDWQRITKSSFSISIDTKIFLDQQEVVALRSNSKIVFACVDNAASTHFYGVGIVENFDLNYGSPSTLTFTIRSYGAPLKWENLTTP